MVHDTNDLKVFISSRDSTCDECKDDLGRGAWITLMEGKGRGRSVDTAGEEALNVIGSGVEVESYEETL